MIRRKFLKNTLYSTLSASSLVNLSNKNNSISKDVPRIISTWNHGVNANKVAWKKLNNGEGGLTAVEFGVRDSENDPNERSVGYGGLPDRDGKVTLDACIMDSNNDLSLIHI